MPVLHRYKDDNGYYLRANPPGIDSPITYQVHKTAERLFESMSYGDGDAIPWEVIKPLRVVGHVYTRGSGIEPPADDFDPEENLDAAQLDDEAADLLRNHFDSYTTTEELDLESVDGSLPDTDSSDTNGKPTARARNHLLFPPTRGEDVEIELKNSDKFHLFEGNGSQFTDSFSLESGPVFISLSHQGSSNLAATLVGKESGTHEELFSGRDIGGFDGQFVDEITGGEYLLNVDGSGPWIVSVTQTTPALLEPPLTVSGRDHAVLGPFEPNQFIGFEFEYYGDFLFYIYGVRESGKTYAGDQIIRGEKSGSATIHRSAAFTTSQHPFIQIQTRGEWKLSMKKA